MGQGFAQGSLAVFYGTLVLAVSLGLWKGGRPEQAGAVLVIASFSLQLASRLILPAKFGALDPVSLAIDALGFAGFAWIGYHARRYWPLCASALQLLSLAGHFARGVERQVEPQVYALMKSAPTYLVLVTLLIGTLCRWRRTMRRAPGG